MAASPLVLVIPVVVATLLAATAPLRLGRLAGAFGALAAAATAVLAAVLLARAHGAAHVAWLANWRPRDGFAIGVAFVTDPFGAGMALLAAVLATAALLASLPLIRESHELFAAVLLVFLGAACGFCLAGDLFTLFACLELMTVAAYVLVGYEVRQRAPLEGALTFAVITTLGTILLVFGIAILYGRTGALNLEAIGHALATRRPDALVAVAWALIAGGLLVKSAAVPFHFWVADAYAVAPTPVALLLSGVFAELGLLGLARVHWTAFLPALAPHAGALRAILVTLGVATALTGALLCAAQHNLRRLLAYATIAQVGLLLCGVGLLTAEALAGTAAWVVGDGLAKASLFVVAGIVQHRLGEADEHDLHGRGRALRAEAALFVIAALAVATIPPTGPFLGKALVEGAASHAPGTYGWLAPLMVVVSALVAGTLLRVAVRVFTGRGVRAPRDPRSEAVADEPADEASGARGATSPLLWAPCVALLAGALAWGLVPGLAGDLAHGAAAFTAARSAPDVAVEPVAYAYGAASALGAVAVAAFALAGGAARAPAAGRRALERVRDLHSGRIGDEAAWLAVGFAGLAAAAVLTVG